MTEERANVREARGERGTVAAEIDIILDDYAP